jgi:hypothetical protein
MSALPSKADIRQRELSVRFVVGAGIREELIERPSFSLEPAIWTVRPHTCDETACGYSLKASITCVE